MDHRLVRRPPATLTRGERIETTIDLAPADSSQRRNRVASTFSAQADDERQGQRREIGLGGLKPGAYVLTVTVHAAGRTATRAASIIITKH